MCLFGPTRESIRDSFGPRVFGNDSLVGVAWSFAGGLERNHRRWEGKEGKQHLFGKRGRESSFLAAFGFSDRRLRTRDGRERVGIIGPA